MRAGPSHAREPGVRRSEQGQPARGALTQTLTLALTLALAPALTLPLTQTLALTLTLTLAKGLHVGVVLRWRRAGGANRNLWSLPLPLLPPLVQSTFPTPAPNPDPDDACVAVAPALAL